ncbi:MAG: sigma 54-interacting transcriptional regulator [Pirellulales bacterium]|nr:sigma 54-interacting transcriptional regulator [Pirellulales bacterium]
MFATNQVVYAYLTILSGSKAGTNFLVDPSVRTLIGRGTDCHIAIPDPLLSRVHASLEFGQEGWVLRDANSRNGTQVNKQKITEAMIDDAHTIQLGKSELQFHLSEDPPTAEGNDPHHTQTIVKDVPLAMESNQEEVISGLPGAEQVKELMLLYQLCIKLLGCGDPDRVVAIALDLLRKRTGAAVIGYLAVTDEGGLKPSLVIPEDSETKIQLSDSLTEIVLRQGHAVWVANQSTSGRKSDSWEHFADAMCAPLVRKSKDGERITLGAIHVYLEAGRFRQSDFDFLITVANLVVVSLVRARELVTLQSDFQRLVETSPGYDNLIGESAPMQELKTKTARVAKATGCVLVRGESGSGKELVARAIHRASPREDRPMISVNCAAIPVDLMESQLFGHKAGSFTGADRDHQGYFQQADQGTLFLDEVGELTLEGQAKLLRILEGHPFLPVGATEEVSVDVRVVAATNQDLQNYVREKKFREDLFYRLSVFELHIPPLRERGDDIGLLINYFLDHYRHQHGRPNLVLAEDAQQKMARYRWPGNVRQLRNVIDSAVVLADTETIRPSDLALRDSGGPDLDTLQIDLWEKKLIVEALRRTNDNVPEAAKLLGIGRATLYRKIEQYKIQR